MLPTNTSANHRGKRGVLNFVGEIQSILFGTLAQSDGQYFNEQIDRLTKNQIQQNDLIKKQTTIIMSSIEAQQEAIRTQELQSKIFQAKMDQLGRTMGQMLTSINAEFRWVENLQDLDELIILTYLWSRSNVKKGFNVLYKL